MMDIDSFWLQSSKGFYILRYININLSSNVCLINEYINDYTVYFNYKIARKQ